MGNEVDDIKFFVRYVNDVQVFAIRTNRDVVDISVFFFPRVEGNVMGSALPCGRVVFGDLSFIAFTHIESLTVCREHCCRAPTLGLENGMSRFGKDVDLLGAKTDGGLTVWADENVEKALASVGACSNRGHEPSIGQNRDSTRCHLSISVTGRSA